jgi:hypothetical protein
MAFKTLRVPPQGLKQTPWMFLAAIIQPLLYYQQFIIIISYFYIQLLRSAVKPPPKIGSWL